MVIEKSANAARKALLATLANALNAGDEALRAVLGQLGLEEIASSRFLDEARTLRQRACTQTPRASGTELELALGVLWVFHTRQSASHARLTR